MIFPRSSSPSFSFGAHLHKTLRRPPLQQPNTLQATEFFATPLRSFPSRRKRWCFGHARDNSLTVRRALRRKLRLASHNSGQQTGLIARPAPSTPLLWLRCRDFVCSPRISTTSIQPQACGGQPHSRRIVTRWIPNPQLRGGQVCKVRGSGSSGPQSQVVTELKNSEAGPRGRVGVGRTQPASNNP